MVRHGVQVEELSSGVAVVTLSRPEVHNAINRDMQKEIQEQFQRLDESSEVGCILLTGAGDRAFSAGFDIHEMSTLSPDEADALSRARDEWAWFVSTLATPMVAALNGVAYGAGVILALASDIRIGCEKTKIKFTAGAYGGVMFTWSLPRLVNHGKASEYLLMAEPIDADEAVSSGLLNRVVPADSLVSVAQNAAETIAGNPVGSMQETKRLLRGNLGESARERFDAEVAAKRGLIAGRAPTDVFGSFLSTRSDRRPSGNADSSAST